MIAPLLKRDDVVRVIAPARSLAMPWMGDDLKRLAQQRLEALGLRVTFGKYVNEIDQFSSTTVEHRVEDLHDAFADPAVTLVLTVIGGFNSNQLLRYLDYDLIAKNPKRLCGFSDITALATAIYAKTGLVTYSGPHFFNFGQPEGFEYTQKAFVSCHFADQPIDVRPAEQFLDAYWAAMPTPLPFQRNPGWRVIQEGQASGTIIGGNLGTFHLLHGTEYLPQPEGDVILFIEDDRDDSPVAFDRNLQSLLHQPLARQVRGVVIGRLEEASGIVEDVLLAIIRSKRELRDVPIITGLDFGHTTPLITFPIGGQAELMAGQNPSIRILTH